MGRTILSVLSGFALWTVLWLGGNLVIGLAMPEAFNDDGSANSTGVLFLPLGLSVICSVLAGLTAAKVARENEMKPVVTLAILQVVVGIIVQLNFWSVIPLWYHLSFLVLLAPAIIFGGKLALGRRISQDAE
jgi:hypothetical protein